MSGEIVKYRNELNAQPLRLNATEQDVFIAILSRLRDHGSESVTFSYDELRTLTQDRGNTAVRFRATVQKVYDKIYDTKCVIDTPHKYKAFHIFRTYEIDKDAETVTISVEDDFVPYLNDFASGNWTRFVLAEFTNLKSKYSKTLFRLLKQWRMKGICIIMIDEFRAQMAVPKSYNMGNIDEKVLRPALNELQGLFPGLKCDKVFEHHHRGRPSVSGFQFTWKPEKRPKKQSQTASSETAKARMTCPECGEKAVIELTARSDSHQFWKCEKCGTTFGSVAEVKGISETPSRTAKIDDTAPKSDDRYIPSPEELDAHKIRMRSKSSESADMADPDTASEQQEKPSKPEKNKHLMMEAGKLKQLIDNSKSGEIGIKKLCNQLEDVIERRNVLADIIPIADAAGYTASVTEYYASDALKPKKIRFDRK